MLQLSFSTPAKWDTITNVKGLLIMNNNRKDECFRLYCLNHEWKPKQNPEEVEFIQTVKHARGLHCVCPRCSFGFGDKLSKAINTDMYHECGHFVGLGKSTGMCSWWAVKIAPCDAVGFCMYQQIFQHILPLSSHCTLARTLQKVKTDIYIFGMA